jgi:hypothetical protein
VVASGQEDASGAVAAQTIQVGLAAAAGQGFLGAGAQMPIAGGQGQGQGQARRLRAVTGAVQAIDAAALTVAAEGGQNVKILVGSDAVLLRTVAGALSDVKVGEQVTIVGQAGQDGVVAAVTVQISGVRVRP